ncbi:hypothetical protein [Listeria monocytogenes]|uniref:Uncharacterized protein n=1 Tax=Listeria monocytogenes TaxID=1639 RepID=A0A6C8MY08_LISMN|nr:hypothetical protein [Listeria monocytogenes]KAA9534122.1 hypothetical protein DCK33_08255 [Listeria monocytogenes]KAA9541453.1 hypothetical protein DCK32_10210 [Listeria monocytogenes]
MNSIKNFGISTKEFGAAMTKLIERLKNNNRSVAEPVQKPKINRQDAFKHIAKQGGRSRGFTR